MKRGQGATELLIIFAVGLAVLLVLITASTDSLTSYKSKYNADLARDAVDSLESAAIYVYQQGDGAKTQVEVSMPTGVNYTNVSTNTILISLLDTREIYRNLEFNVSGNLPATQGYHLIDLKSVSGVVYISENISALEFCRNDICESGENCPQDVNTCTDNVCYDPTCTSGCGQTAIVSAIDTGECDSQTIAGNCDSLPCICDASSVCDDVPSTGIAEVEIKFHNYQSAYPIYPNESLKISLNVSCTGADCGNVSVYLAYKNVSSVSYQISADSDDAEEDKNDGGAVDINNFDLNVVEDTPKWQEVGLRWQGVRVTQNSTIESAFVQFETDATGSDSTSLNFYGEDVDDSATFTTTNFDITSRSKTSNVVTWSSVPEFSSVGVRIGTPDLSPIIKEIVSRGNWAIGNDLSVIINGTGQRIVESWKGDSGAAAWLFVNYTNGSLVQVPTVDNSLPFFINGTNPRNVNLSEGVSVLVDFWLNGTAALGSNYTIFANANVTANMSINDMSNYTNISFNEKENTKIFLDLWPMDGSYPVSFNNGVNYSALTFWHVGLLDGWDWRNNVYAGRASTQTQCVIFSNNSNLGVAIGDENCAAGDNAGRGSGAFGIKFHVNSSLLSMINAGSIANLSFQYNYTPMADDLDSGEEYWIKATFGNGTIFGSEDWEVGALGSSHKWAGGTGWNDSTWYTEGTNKDVVTTSYSGEYGLQIKGSGTPVYIDRKLTLEDASNPRVSFWAKATNLESGDILKFKVSNNDSTWYTLDTWTDGIDEDNTWRYYDFDLTDYYFNSSTFYVAFDADGFDQTNDIFYMDELIIYQGNVSYIGSHLDSGNAADITPEIYFTSDPGTTSLQNFVNYDLGSYIRHEGWYYLTFGAVVNQWSAHNEGANTYFDNIQMYVE